MGMKLAAMLAVAMMVMGLGFSWYYKNTQAQLMILNQNNAKLETAVQLSEQAVASLQADYKRANAELSVLNNEFAAIRAQNNVLVDKLANNDLGGLAAAKPAPVTKIINSATEKAGRCFEILSGSPLTAKEKDSKDAKTFNSECPWLWSGAASN